MAGLEDDGPGSKVEELNAEEVQVVNEVAGARTAEAAPEAGRSEVFLFDDATSDQGN